MIKIIMDSRADNGNRFLCRECVHAFSNSGSMMEDRIYCRADGGGEIDFKVTKCSNFALRILSDYGNKPAAMLKREAWFYDQRTHLYGGKKNPNFGKFVPFCEAVNENLVREDSESVY